MACIHGGGHENCFECLVETYLVAPADLRDVLCKEILTLRAQLAKVTDCNPADHEAPCRDCLKCLRAQRDHLHGAFEALADSDAEARAQLAAARARLREVAERVQASAVAAIEDAAKSVPKSERFYAGLMRARGLVRTLDLDALIGGDQ